MRFIHSADWHLGRLFHGVQLVHDQAHVLDQIVDIVGQAKPDLFIIAGDIYDRAVPPPEAVDLFDDVLSRVALQLKIPVLLIAGNHDSPQRLAFGSRLMAKEQVYVFGVPTEKVGVVRFDDDSGPVYFHAVPYADPPVVRQCFQDSSVLDHDIAMQRFIKAIAPSRDRGVRNVLVAHAFVSGGTESESERPLCVGGAGTVDAKCFDAFDYVALGHLHRPQVLHNGRVHYSGSPLKYSFSESGHQKSLNIVEIDGARNCKVEQVILRPRHDVCEIHGFLSDLLKGPTDGISKEDYIHVTLDDAGALIDPMGKLREVYPNILGLERPALSAPATDGPRIDHKSVGDAELFGHFFEHVTGQKATPEQATVFSSTVNKLRRAEREQTA